MTRIALQDEFAPKSICYGCGPANTDGLQIKSYAEGDECIATFFPKPFHHAFPGVVNGGILGALLDCHSNWTAAHHLMKKAGPGAPLPCTVTADFHVTLKRPTPMDAELRLRAKVVEDGPDRATVEATIEANGKITATCRGLFVAVKEGHPAFHRW